VLNVQRVFLVKSFSYFVFLLILLQHSLSEVFGIHQCHDVPFIMIMLFNVWLSFQNPSPDRCSVE